jgi:hypothetical protein
MPWLLNEDAAIKAKLQGLKVFDANATQGRKVPVRFRLPETEVADLTFPIIVIQHDGWTIANDREHRGFVTLPYAPEGFAPWWNDTGPATTVFNPSDSPYWGFIPIPYNLDYTVTVYTRIMHEHMMPLIAALAAYDRLNPKFAFLDVPQDGTKRTLQLLGGPVPVDQYDANGKRVFSAVYKVRVFSELVPEVLQYAKATDINIDLSVYDDISDISPAALTEAKGLLSVGAPLSWNVATPLQ